MDMINDNGRKANAEEIFKHFFSSQVNPFGNMISFWSWSKKTKERRRYSCSFKYKFRRYL